MGKKNPKKAYRLSIVEEQTHRSVRSIPFTKPGLIASVVTIVVAIIAITYALVAFTPIRTTIPGYPDKSFRREVVANAIKIDSLEAAITRWKLYSENLSRALSGDTTIKLDSLLSAHNPTDSLLTK